ncbi:hypothetical protein EFA69_18275 [Rufibacter immobilis]|uniref:O-antigen ligase-related domain-containing protein n=1 Tax=Rufibacter immobilis TaxID=1348778 RepID=A0A3M9MRA4_9BACT|nr:O-antigen ligase family protein [Rufibacter immobilis]RNI28031.1 hypothetical protein EFA69_18275 [Rufibacter immobilis]
MTFSSRISIAYVLVIALLVTILCSGFITNFLSFSHLNLATLLIDWLIALVLLHFFTGLFFAYYRGQKIRRSQLIALGIWLLLLFTTILKLLFIDANPMLEKLLGLRNNLIYSCLFLYLPFFLRREDRIRTCITVILFVGTLLCLFALFQFTFSSSLPMPYLVLRGESTFGFYGTEIVRPTALLGNTIIFSSFTVILATITLSRYMFTRNKVYLVLLLLILLTNILTFTRAALVGFFLSGATVLILQYGRFTLVYLIKAFSMLLLLLVLTVSLGSYFKDTFLVQRITGQDASSISSTEGHYTQISSSLDYFQRNLWTGVGTGSQGPSSSPERVVITDGYWFQLLMENGLPLSILYLSSFILSFFYTLRLFFITHDLSLRQLCLCFLGCSAYFYAASFLNSAIAGKVNFILYWMIFGFVLAQRAILKEREKCLPLR